MSQFLDLPAASIDQDSPLTGLNAAAPNRDSVGEIMRERDAYLYERLFGEQAPSDPSFFGAVTTDKIDDDAIAQYTVPADIDRPNNGIMCNQLRGFNASLNQWKTTLTIAGTVQFEVTVRSGVTVDDGVWFVGWNATPDDYDAATLSLGAWRVALSGGAWVLSYVLNVTGIPNSPGIPVNASIYAAIWSLT